MGLLSYFGVPQDSLLGNIGQTLSDNSGLLMGYGAAGAAGMLEGSQSDDRRKLQRQKMAEEEKRKQAAAQLAAELKLPAALASDPDVVMSLAAKKYMPRDLSFEERQFNALTPDQQSQYRQRHFLSNGESNLGEQVRQRQAAASQLGLTPQHPAYQSYILTGKMPREDAQALTATDKKELWSSEDDLPALDSTIGSLARAKELNTQTFTGRGSEVWGNLGTSDLPFTGYIDQDKAKATKEFSQIMSLQTIETMVNTLKGATTDNELQQFKSILADPSTPPEIRGRTIDRMKTLAERKKEIAINRIQSIGGPDYLKNRGGPSAQQAPGAIQVDGYTIRQR